jgi:site-specific recombinase XerD
LTRISKQLSIPSPKVVQCGRRDDPALTTVDALAFIPEEQVWIAGLKTENTRRAYQLDVTHFLQTVGIASGEALYRVDHRAVILWEKWMREVEHLEPSTIRRRLSALSSLYSHLVKHDVVPTNPVREIKRPEIDRSEGRTLAFSQKEARKILEAPSPDTIIGMRDRAILSVGFQVGFRRAEISGLLVDALHRNRGLDALWVRRKRKRNRQSVTINAQTAQRIRRYLEMAGHTDDLSGPLFRPTCNNGGVRTTTLRRHLHPDGIDRVLRKYAKVALGCKQGYSAHSMRATFATTALANGADIEEVQYTLGHAEISTTKLYDRRGHNPEKAAAYFANY